MNSAAVHSTQEPVVAPMHKTQRPQLCQARALLWKEWREQRLTLVLALLVVLCLALGARLTELREPMLVGGFCAIALGFVLGAAVVGAEGRTMAFIKCSPIPVHVVWLVKMLLGLAVAGTVGLVTPWVFEMLAEGKGLEHWRDGPSALMLCVACFTFSQYFAWWVKSPISAIGLGLLLGGAVAGLAILNPLHHYLRGYLDTVAVLLGLGVLLWLGRTWFLRDLKSEHRLSRRRALARFLLPVLLLGLLPNGVGLAVLLVDDWHLDPTDVSCFYLADGPLVHGHLLLGAESGPPFRQHWWWVWDKVYPSLVAISLRDGQAHRRLPHGIGWARHLGPVSPDGRYLVIGERPRTRREARQFGASRWSIVDVSTGSMVGQLGNALIVRGSWGADGLLVFYWQDYERGHGWGTWDARNGEVQRWPDPSGLTWPDTRFCTFLDNPLRLAFYSRYEYHSDRPNQVCLLNVADRAVQAFTLPELHSFSGLSWDGRFALAHSWAGDQTERESRSPKLVELETGKNLDLQDILGSVPPAGWPGTTAFFSEDRRWLFVTPQSNPARRSSKWYCIDMATLTATLHEPPAPNGPGALSPDSDRFAERFYLRAGLLTLSLKRRDARVVIVPRGAPGEHESFKGGTMDMAKHFRRWRLGDFRWLDEDRLVMCVSTWSEVGVIVANVRTRTVRPLWPADGLGMEWRVVTWDEWRQNAPTD